MSRLIDLMGSPVHMNAGGTSDGITSDTSSAYSGISILGCCGILFVALNQETIGEGTNITITVAYSTTGNGSDATTSTDIWASSNAVLTFTTALGLAAGSIRTLWLDVCSKNMSANGYVHLWFNASETVDNVEVIAIPWPSNCVRPVYAASVDAS